MAVSAHEEVRWSVELHPDRETVAVVPAGELDRVTVPDLERAVAEVREAGFSAIRLDLRRLTFIDSGGLHFVVELAGSPGLELSIVAGPPAVQRLFEVTGLAATLPFERRRRFPSRASRGAGATARPAVP